VRARTACVCPCSDGSAGQHSMLLRERLSGDAEARLGEAGGEAATGLMAIRRTVRVCMKTCAV
jgi:hypothetical protein